MNPQDNNPTGAADPGATAGEGSSIAPPVDFTAEAGDNSLSMTDSLASAQDNLTSAGMAAADSGPVAMGLDQIGASDPSATMARPEAPLVPADPVPGSIGSATSGPALTDTTAPAEPATAETVAAAPVMATTETVAPTAPAMDATAAPAMDVAAPAGAMMGAETVPAANPVAPPVSPAIPGAIPVMNGAAVSNAAAAETPAQAPYNPFASAGGQSATSAALQPRTEKFSGKGNGGSKFMTVLFAVLSLILAATTVLFLVLWQGALNDNKKPSGSVGGGTQQPVEEGGTNTNSDVLCVKPQTDEGVGATGEERVRLLFEDGLVKTVVMGATATYPDEIATDNAVAAAQMAISLAQEAYGADLGDGLIRNGNELSFDMTIDVAKVAESTRPVDGVVDDGGEIEGEFSGSASASIGALKFENGAVLNPAQSELVPAFEAEGYTCN